MAGKEQENRIFVGGLGFDVTERQLEDAFSRYGKIIDTQIMVERGTGRPRGFGFLTFANHRGMEDAIREMHGRELGNRMISVNKAEPKMWSEDAGHGYSGGYSSGSRGSYGGGDRSVGQDDCFKCGRPGHWARDCPSAGGGRGGGQFSSRTRFGGPGGHGDRFRDHDRYIDDRYDGGRYMDRDHYDSRERYGSRDRYVHDRYQSSASGDRFAGDRYGGSDRYPKTGFGKDRIYDRDGGPRGHVDRYGGGRPSSRYEGRSYNDRPGPYDRSPRRGGRPTSSLIAYNAKPYPNMPPNMCTRTF